MEAAWEDLRRRVAAFTEEFGRSVVLSSSLGHVGTCYTSSTLRASVDDSLRRSDNDIRHRRDVRLGQDPEAIPMRQLRVKISSLIGGTRVYKAITFFLTRKTRFLPCFIKVKILIQLMFKA
ncbi:uncharacterized protein LOC128559790 [Mercenaria mercenaria]|uniref:uncharacterized protein LOC128559790 n=1 Tax=Mercenaria mercenaria TaxID=6596 RepID=UPI00234F0E11|nr:uncharacterized protein LOC128559790 [Mercenaria mercenaria]